MACPLSAWAGPKLLGQEPQAKALQTGLEPPPRLGTGKMGGGARGAPVLTEPLHGAGTARLECVYL